jgi:xanthine dehydrogenase YagS FAD-binding subunit
MREFRIAQPRTVDELAALLAETEEKTALMAGGTDLIDELKSGVAGPDIVVDIQGIEALAGIVPDKNGLRIGPMTRVAALAEDAAVARDYPILKEAALSLATPQLRNVGTVGGNLCQRPRCWYYRDPEVVCRKKGGALCFAFRGRNKYHAIMGGSGCYIVYPSDLAPALISFGAKVTIGSAKGDKVMPLEDFYKPPFVNVQRENVLAAGEFLKDIRVPAPKPGQKGTYVKLKERGTWDFAVASAAATGVVKGGVFSEIAIVAGGLAPIPWRMKAAEDILRGKPVTEALVRQAADEALKAATPLAENAYKIDLAAAAIRRAVLALLE